ncbi:putative transcription factor B3-Domain family [Helianthus annuus]|nr:putative transcription factor B3-Domain family [Helianthus annuus]
MSFNKCFSSVTKEFLAIPELFSKTWLSSAIDNNNVIIRCVNDKTWLVNFVRHNGRFAFMEDWEKVVADLSLSEGTVLVFRKIGPYTFLLTPFMKNTIGVPKLKGAMKVYINAWNWFDVFIEKDPISKCYFFGDGWKKVVGFLGFNEKCVVMVLLGVTFLWMMFLMMRTMKIVVVLLMMLNPVQFVWKFDRHFHLNARVAEMSRIDMSLKLTIQNLHGVDIVIDFRPEKHGQGFRYAASQWRKKFLIPNDIKASEKCTFVYEPDVGKLILKKVST